ncbi:MAG: chorismate mutase [Ahrensia sp.]|nr:chorismate mutase [Ahrensia sp.]
MSTKTQNNPQRLTELRAKIDAVDESIHTLLMQRASVIDELILVKGADVQTGAAFRPAREASMMQTLASRHRGSIPLQMIIHIWRDIISTFTHLQANYTVHLTNEGDANRLRDMARFQFGFSVPIKNHDTSRRVFDAVTAEGNALAVIPLEGAGCWWQYLNSNAGLGIMARLPVIGSQSPDHHAFVISPPISDAAPYDVRCYAGTIKSADALLGWTGGEIIAISPDDSGKLHALIAISEGGTAPNNLIDIRAVGGYFVPINER